MNMQIVIGLVFVILISHGLSLAEENILPSSEVEKLVERISDGMGANPQLLEESKALPVDRRFRLLAYAISRGNDEVVSVARRLIRETPRWDDYIEEKLTKQWPMVYDYQKKHWESLLGGPGMSLTQEQQKICLDAEFEIIRMYDMLQRVGDLKAVRFLMIGIYDNTPTYHALDVVGGAPAQTAIARMKEAMTKEGGGLVIPNAPKSSNLADWRKWWDENKNLYIPAGKSDLFTDYGVVKTPIPPRPAWVSKVRLIQTPAPTPSHTVARPTPAPENRLASSANRWGIAGVSGVLFLTILVWLWRTKR